MPSYPYIEPGNVPAENFQDALSLKEDKANKGIAHGYAPLDANAKVPAANLPDQASLDAEVAAAIETHRADTTNVHGIADTSQLATLSSLSNHESDTTNIHGISDTNQLVDLADLADGIANHSDDTTNVHGISDTANLCKIIQLPFASFPQTGAVNTLYLDTLTETFYRWTGTAYVEISPYARVFNSNISVANGNFSNLTGLTQRTAQDQLHWYDGSPVGWVNAYQGQFPGFNIIRINNTPTYGANVSQLSSGTTGSLSNAFRQVVGPFGTNATLTIAFEFVEILAPLGFQDSTIGAGVWDSQTQAFLATTIHTSPGVKFLTANVTAGQNLAIGFWAVLGAPVVTNVSISSAEKKTWLFPPNLPTTASGLLPGEIYKDANNFLKIV